jgi:hypothetical protein
MILGRVSALFSPLSCGIPYNSVVPTPALSWSSIKTARLAPYSSCTNGDDRQSLRCHGCPPIGSRSSEKDPFSFSNVRFFPFRELDRKSPLVRFQEVVANSLSPFFGGIEIQPPRGFLIIPRS